MPKKTIRQKTRSGQQARVKPQPEERFIWRIWAERRRARLRRVDAQRRTPIPA